MDAAAVLKLLEKTKVLRGPGKRLATFGGTRIRYRLVSPVEDLGDRSRLREGVVVSEKPRILTPDGLRERFEGFDDDARSFGEWLLKTYGDELRALEYRFKNEAQGARVLRDSPEEVAGRVLRELAEANDAAILLCPDAAWQVALMKLLLDEARKAFGGHVQELESKGFFRSPEDRRRDEIEGLFRRAEKDRGELSRLGQRLKESRLFDEYEDRFFQLVGRWSG